MVHEERPSREIVEGKLRSEKGCGRNGYHVLRDGNKNRKRLRKGKDKVSVAESVFEDG